MLLWNNCLITSREKKKKKNLTLNLNSNTLSRICLMKMEMFCLMKLLCLPAKEFQQVVKAIQMG